MAITEERYVSITTYRRSGEAVATPVWIAGLDDGRAGFTTGAGSGKVKRLRRDARVALRPCDMRGRVPDGAIEVTATAEVATSGPEVDQVIRAERRKYGWQFRALEAGNRPKGLFTSVDDCVVVVTLDR